MIHYNTKATFENFENTNKSTVDCEMIHNKKEEETHTSTHRETKNQTKTKCKNIRLK